MTKGTLLVVEDDSELRGQLCRGLEEEGFRVEGVGSGGEVLDRFEALGPDALVVDIGLPDSDGRDVCQALRSRGCDAPILFLTARDSLAERLSGFDAGGDDYVTKPFAFAEVVARLEALLRRAGATGAIEAAGLQLDPVAHEVRHGPVSASLTPTEFRLLARLLTPPGGTVRRRELVRAAWPHGAIVRENTLDAYIGRLRKKLRELGAPVAITTQHGVGYRLR
jgi:two-component system response regulator MprA